MCRWMGICPTTKQPFVGPEKERKSEAKPRRHDGARFIYKGQKGENPQPPKGPEALLGGSGASLVLSQMKMVTTTISSATAM